MALEYIEYIESESHVHFIIRWCFYIIGGVT